MIDAIQTGQPLLTVADVVRITGLHERTVRRLVHEGDLACIHLHRKNLKFVASDIDQFLESRRKGGAPQQAKPDDKVPTTAGAGVKLLKLPTER